MCFIYWFKILLNVIFTIHPVICLEHIAQIFHPSFLFFAAAAVTNTMYLEA